MHCVMCELLINFINHLHFSSKEIVSFNISLHPLAASPVILGYSHSSNSVNQFNKIFVVIDS